MPPRPYEPNSGIEGFCFLLHIGAELEAYVWVRDGSVAGMSPCSKSALTVFRFLRCVILICPRQVLHLDCSVTVLDSRAGTGRPPLIRTHTASRQPRVHGLTQDILTRPRVICLWTRLPRAERGSEGEASPQQTVLTLAPEAAVAAPVSQAAPGRRTVATGRVDGIRQVALRVVGPEARAVTWIAEGRRVHAGGGHRLLEVAERCVERIERIVRAAHRGGRGPCRCRRRPVKVGESCS
jgi:hypothetical protein